jgi:hypothetical protein
MSRLSITLDQKVGDACTVVPVGDGYMISLGRCTEGGAIFITMPDAQMAILMAKMSAAMMMREAPAELDAGIVKAGDAGRGVLAALRAKLEAQGAELTAPSDDFGLIGESSLGSPTLSTAISNIGPCATPDQILTAMGLWSPSDGALAPAEVYDPRRDETYPGDNVVQLRAPKS